MANQGQAGPITVEAKIDHGSGTGMVTARTQSQPQSPPPIPSGWRQASPGSKLVVPNHEPLNIGRQAPPTTTSELFPHNK